MVSSRSWAFGVGNLSLGAGLLLLAALILYQTYRLSAEAQLAQLNRALPHATSDAPAGAASILARGTYVEEAELGLGPPPLESLPQPGVPATGIIIPSIDVDAKVVALGTEWRDGQLVWQTASHAVGHYRNTAYPGQAGNIVMSGHMSSPVRGEGSVFRRLPELQLNDVIILHTEAGPYRYRVVATQVVEPGDVHVMDPTPTQTLTLITCVPDLVYSHRFVVTAKPIP